MAARSVKCFLWIVASLILSSSPLRAAEIHTLQSSDLVIHFEPPLAATAQDVIRIYPEIRASLEKTVGWQLRGRPSILLIGQEEQFQRMAESPLTLAFAVPQKNVIVIDYSRVTQDPFRLGNTIKHELCHLLLHEHIPGKRIPRWLDEGVCQWVSDGISDIVMRQKRSVLHRVALRGRFIPLSALTNAFPVQDQALILAYEESKSFVSHIIKQHGWQAMQQVLGQMSNGLDVFAAFEQVLDTPLDELERQWQESVSRRTSWFTYLSYYLYEILFGLAALLAMVGFVKAVIRKRRLLRDYEDEEAAFED